MYCFQFREVAETEPPGYACKKIVRSHPAREADRRKKAKAAEKAAKAAAGTLTAAQAKKALEKMKREKRVKEKEEKAEKKKKADEIKSQTTAQDKKRRQAGTSQGGPAKKK
jgi:hypothetical protein